MRLYFFGNGQADGSGALRELLGTKGAELAEMARLGIPVPAGFTLSTEVCRHIRDHGWDAQTRELLHEGVATLEAMTERNFGSATTPLLVSVRAGATRALPGCLTTVLNVGLNEQSVHGLSAWANNEYFAWQVFLRAQQEFGQLVQGIDAFYFEEERDLARSSFGVAPQHALPLEGLFDLHRRFANLPTTWDTPPNITEPYEQLRAAIEAAIASLDAPHTRIMRERRGNAQNDAVAVNIQTMVFGNVDNQSGTGILWTRDRRSGAPGIDGDFLFEAQGEDVVAQEHHALPIQGENSLQTQLPEIGQRLVQVGRLLENHYRDMQQIEFTVERGELWVLQTREARRSFEASMQVAVDFVHEGLITQDDALRRIEPQRIRQLLHPRVQKSTAHPAIARGIPTSPGAASGRIVLSAQEAERLAGELNVAVILVKKDTAPGDIAGIRYARGVLTARGGMTSHAAVVTRQMGKPSVVGCKSLHIQEKKRKILLGDHTLEPGDIITIDGATGDIYLGEVALKPPEFPPAWTPLVTWADARKSIGIRANADSAGDARLAMHFGAEGIGLVRTEHMFLQSDRLHLVQQMILAQDSAQRQAALERLRPLQTQDFYDLFKAVDGAPVTVRLLDPPLHEFLPHRREDMVRLAQSLDIELRVLQDHAARLREQNPMLGHRGCRLAVSWPEIYDMQATSVFEAMHRAQQDGVRVQAELLIPLVSDPEEFRYVRDRIFENYRPWKDVPGMPDRPRIGSMIEVPRACLLADEIARLADFISYGTNDLTQSIYGLSRDDASSFLPAYLDSKIMRANPFAVLDQEGVGWFIRMASKKARSANPDIRIGICGEQSADPQTIHWLQNGTVDYISCSPYRVPIARFAAGRAAIVYDERTRT